MDYADRHKHVTKYFVSLAKRTDTCKQETLTMLSLTEGNVSSALGSTILSALVARDAEYVATFKLVYHMTFCGVHWN
jgi:hypothetical protein